MPGCGSLHFEPLEQRHLLSVTLNPITGPDPGPVYDIPAGKDLYVPLNGTDTGQSISYSATSSNPNVQVSVLSGNPTLELDVSGTDSTGHAFSGTMTFQLFQNIAPQTVQGIINQVNAGLYNGASFYRMETGSTFQLIQGGIEKTSGKTDTTVLPDEFNAAAAFNTPGLLAMANAGPGTATSEFFVTGPTQPLADEPQFLNFGYTIFGQILTGQSVYNEVLNVPTTASGGIDFANTPVTITSAKMITDTQNGVLQVSEPNNFTGNATITVTATGSDSTTAQQSFNVSVVAPATSSEQGVVLNPVSNVVTTLNQAVTFQLSASDTTGGTPTFSVSASGPFAESPYPSPSNVTVQVNGSSVTLTPATGFTGTINLVAHADDSSNHDAEAFTLTVAGPLTVATPAGQQAVKAGSPSGVSGVSLSDPGLPATDNVTATLGATDGTVTLSTAVSGGITSGQVTANGTGSVMVTAPLAAINATLAATGGLMYTPTGGFTGADTLAITASDTVGNSNQTGSVALVVAGPLAITAPSAQQTVKANGTLPIAGVSFADTGLPTADNVTETFVATSGTVTLSTAISGGVTVGQVMGNSTGSVTVTAPWQRSTPRSPVPAASSTRLTAGSTAQTRWSSRPMTRPGIATRATYPWQ